MKKIFILLFCILTAVLPLTAAADGETQATDGTSYEDKWLKLSDNVSGARYFTDINGNPVNLFGMARCQHHADEEDYMYSATGDADALVKHYADLGCNFMRLAIEAEEICKEGGGTSEEDINKFITNKVDPDVQAIIRNGMYVMLDVHMYPPTTEDSSNKAAAKAVQYAYDNYIPILKALAAKYANEPMVAVIEIWNEPYAADVNGLTFNKDVWNGLIRQFYIDAVDEIRKTDKKHVLLVSDWNAGWGTALTETWNGYFDKLDKNYRNTAHSIHVSHQQLDIDYAFYSEWFKNTAKNYNLCLLFGEIETEPGIMTDNGIKNMMKLFTETEKEYHFSGMLWRPHNDEINYVSLWKNWVKGYVKAPVSGFRDIIEAENFADKSGTAKLLQSTAMFGAPSVGTGISMLPGTAANKYYEASQVGGRVYPAGSYRLTVSALGSPTASGGFTVGYRTVSGEIRQIAKMQGSAEQGALYNQTVSFTSDEQICGFVFFSCEETAESVGIDRIYLTADGGVETQKKTAVTVNDVTRIKALDGKEYDPKAAISGKAEKAAKTADKADRTPVMIIMSASALTVVLLLILNSAAARRKRKIEND